MGRARFRLTAILLIALLSLVTWRVLAGFVKPDAVVVSTCMIGKGSAAAREATCGKLLANRLLAADQRLPVLLNRAKARFDGKDVAGAKADVEAALAVAPESAHALNWKDYLLLAEGKRDEADAVFQSVIGRFPKDGYGHWQVISFLRKEGAFEEAEVRLRALPPGLRNAPYLVRERGLVKFNLKRFAAANGDLAATLERSPEDFELFQAIIAVCRFEPSACPRLQLTGAGSEAELSCSDALATLVATDPERFTKPLSPRSPVTLIDVLTDPRSGWSNASVEYIGAVLVFEGHPTRKNAIEVQVLSRILTCNAPGFRRTTSYDPVTFEKFEWLYSEDIRHNYSQMTGAYLARQRPGAVEN